jgi:presenilin-like A22 family membrane protease
MIFKPALLLKEILLFGSALVVGLVTANFYLDAPAIGGVAPVQYSFDYQDAIYFALFVIIFYFVLTKLKWLASLTLSLFLIILVFSGSHIVAGVMFDTPWDFGLAVLFTLVFIFLRNVLIHNIGMILGLAGVGTILGLTIAPSAAVMLMIFLSVYDILAVYWTRHMVYLAQGMIESGSIFGFVIPSTLRGFFVSGKEAKSQIGNNFMILGSGDIGLPIIFVASVASHSLPQAMLVAGFSVLGLVTTHLIFVNQSVRKPMAALPPIATATIIGYLLAIAIF